ncbi:phosphoribosylaminoimidazole carboxylase / phosphoribosylaminoimidazole-succinocarboxamide synthase [Faunimonas pinastri]|uniref:phosphoribosylaminoimidazolesuccinocarboxamide synthase n=1 Tax=Faunimonas pinastri TaxID=1855383 RepID=A0A1H9N9H0_9HYPH|nr:phosphoribosylaminoimidazolesuccinocarboxamide synthase [Faunimonas pinastri]SER32451.1 phosphoribosylaminoimidazole carboxylase / phosphoribosylaminoimidazole-succinocarboxamide synthase [Faunimonas pinastri]
MSAEVSSRYRPGRLLNEGKTKQIHEVEGDVSRVILVSKDDITAGDGAKHDVMAGKAAFANQTACNNFRLLKAAGIPVAFDEQSGPTSFVSPKCSMLPYEVVARREAHGSYLKRSPHLSKGQLFSKLLVEFFLKTKDRRWKEHSLIADDPLMIYDGEKIDLFDPAKPIYTQTPFLTLRPDEVFEHQGEQDLFPDMAKMASRIFLTLEKAWQLEGGRLVDFKVEFGLTPDGKLLLADVVDNDSWRVIRDGGYIDKQVYREGGALDEVTENYRRVADITGGFRLPEQQIIIWTGSTTDDTSPIEKAIAAISPVKVTKIVCSAHKEPVKAVGLLQKAVQETPDAVVIALIGRSNGAGPVLSANTHVPVITIPANAKEFPEDVWSSLRMPRNVPVLVALEPANAAQAALQMLAGRNPKVYADVKTDLESRAFNVMEL